MDSLQNILGDRDFSPPDEISVVKDYINLKYKSSCNVRLEGENIIVMVPSSELAGTLRLEQQDLIEKCNLGNKRLVIRVGR